MRLILISGPVASGKTTLARRLAERARGRGVPAASIDMDELVEAVAGSNWSRVTDAHRRLACEQAAGIVRELLSQGSKLLAIAGSTLSQREWQRVLAHLDPALPATCVLLRVSVAEAARRAGKEPGRIVTRNPDVVARLHRAIEWDKVRKPDIEIDTDKLSPEEVAEAVEGVVPAPPGSGHR